jgi:dTDP-glucose 4,6-dehydratase
MRSSYNLPVNCGNPHEMTIREFGEAVARHFGIAARFDPKPLPPDDPKVRKPDIRKAQELLGWQPIVEFDAGVAQTIAFFRNQQMA